ncbi:unnamed protein product [Orchesella dallaii]|uniref:Uncharacterized protein n=1 Tax=Orchesella dallaii TaxID=48710 RepID=A0ABP1QI73_9HEXA
MAEKIMSSTIGSDDTYPLMLHKIEILTAEKLSLEDRLNEITSQLEEKTRENLDLKSRCDELLQLLEFELEKTRIRWPQQQSISENVEDNLGGNAFYEDTINSLLIVQEDQNTEIRNLREFYEDELKLLSSESETQVSEIIEDQLHQVEMLIGDNEELVKDLLTGYEDFLKDMKREFTEEASRNTALQRSSGTNILTQFQELAPMVKGIMIAGIAAIKATARWVSWGFIEWVWPRLLAFAKALGESPEDFAFLFDFLSSGHFKKFMRAWEEGKPLEECLNVFANTEFLSSALRIAPKLFKQLKKLTIAI